MYFILCLLAIGVNAQFTSTGQSSIVDAHNKLRSAIAKSTYVAKGTKKEPATDMRKMVVDSTVAASAQNYANTCPTGHSKGTGYGENLYWSWTSADVGSLDSYGEIAAAAWEKEFQDFGWKSNAMDTTLFNSGIGHATQMAWANTSSIGCGVKNCGRDASMRNMNKIAVVCQYSPPGNTMGRPIYKEGTTCSSCSGSTKCDTASGLCG